MSATDIRQLPQPECRAVGPQRWLWGNRTNLVCNLPKGHPGPHCDSLITGYSKDGWFPR